MYYLVMMGAALALTLSPAYAADMEVKTVDKDCWTEIFEDAEFDRDDPHLKIQGPARIPSLKGFKGRDWDDDIQSIIVGPNAMVKVYTEKDYEGKELVLTPDKRVSELDDFEMSNNIGSMKLMCGT